MKKITILGSGLVGSLMAVMLRNKGYEVDIFERREDIRKGGAYAGKSINLAMSTRGWSALEKAGLKSELAEIALPMYGRQIHNLDSSQAYQAYGKNNEAIYSVSRSLLNITLMNKAEALGAKIHFNKKSKNVDVKTNCVIFEDGSQHTAEILLGTDGAFSSLRGAYMQLDRSDYQQFYIQHGYKELHIAPGENNTYLLQKDALHIWPRKNFMLIALANTDGSFTCTLFFPFEGAISFEALDTDEKIKAFFIEQFPNIVTLIPDYLAQYKANPTSSLITIKTFPWVFENKSALLGDAAHAIVPFYGQGMNAGFEDCNVLDTLIDKFDNNWDEIFKAYQKARKINGDAVAQLALNNFIEMRDLVADPKFLERKKIEKELGNLYPKEFLSVYEMVSFSNTPYSVALQATEAQNKLYQKIINNAKPFFSSLGNEDYKNQLNNWIKEYSEDLK